MDASQFAMWLQGFAELNAAPPTKEQWQSIREHLQLVFAKVTPPLKQPSAVEKANTKVDNDALRKFVESSRKDNPKVYPDFIAPQIPYQPYWLNPGGVGVITC